MSDLKPEYKAEQTLAEEMYGMYYEVFRSVGISLGIQQLERLQVASARMAKTLEKHQIMRLLKVQSSTADSMAKIITELGELRVEFEKYREENKKPDGTVTGLK